MKETSLKQLSFDHTLGTTRGSSNLIRSDGCSINATGSTWWDFAQWSSLAFPFLVLIPAMRQVAVSASLSKIQRAAGRARSQAGLAASTTSKVREFCPGRSWSSRPAEWSQRNCLSLRFALECRVRQASWSTPPAIGNFSPRLSEVQPNHSLKRSATGRPPGPGCRYAAHYLQPGPGNLPLAPA